METALKLLEELKHASDRIGELESENTALKSILDRQLNRLILMEIELDTIPDIIRLLDKDLRIVRMNRSGHQFFGTTEATAIGKRCTELPTCGFSCSQCIAEKTLTTGKTASAESHAEEYGLWMETRCYPIFDDSGRLIHLLEHIRDITDRKSAEIILRESYERIESKVVERTKELAQMNERLKQEIGEKTKAREEAIAAYHAKSDFLAQMSHEIRTPMTSISGNAELLMLQTLPEEAMERIRFIEEASKSLLTAINDILDISKMEAGRMEIEELEISLKDLVEEVATLLKVQADRKGIQITIRMDSQLPDSCMGDRIRIKQVLINLIGNAIKFTANGSVNIEVLLTVKEKTPHVKFIVRDTGIGISPDRIPSLFHEYMQAERATARRFGGTGLGLSISRKLISLMGGTITVESALGKGSAFAFTLPLIPVSAETTIPLLDEHDLSKICKNNEPLDPNAGWNFLVAYKEPGEIKRKESAPVTEEEQ